MIIASELITNKMQQLFGAKYEIKTLHAFNENFTNPKMTQYGSYTIEYQCFDEYADKIIGVVQVQPTAQNFTTYEYTSVNFSMQFWVPVNHVKRKTTGELAEDIKFDFLGDIKRVEKALRGQEVVLKRPTGEIRDAEFVYENLRAFFTLDEPVLSSGKEISGAYNRVVYTVNGTANICEQNVNVGNDCKIKFVLDGEEIEIEQYRTLAIGSTMDANSIQSNGSLAGLQEPAVTSRQLTFFIDDVATQNKAYKVIEQKAFENLEIINADYNNPDNEKFNINKARKVHVKIYKRGITKADFWGIMSAQYTTSGGNGFGSYQVTIVDSGE